MDGILAVDKPYGWTSHDVVAKLRSLAHQRRIGHAGTLDPMATGVLLLCLGDATRVSEMLMEGVKWYLARVAFGVATDTDDALGTVLSMQPASFTVEQLIAALRQQVGALQQTPPAFAAIKSGGVPSYRRARAGQAVELAPRSVTVHSITLLEFAPAGGKVSAGPSGGTRRGGDADTTSASRPGGESPARGAMGAFARPSGLARATILVSCGKGTYIRSIARDVGSALGCGAHLSGLRRLASGGFTTSDCAEIGDLQRVTADQGLTAIERRLVDTDAALADWPAIVVDAKLAAGIANGARFVVERVLPQRRARLYSTRGALLGLADVDTLRADHSTVQPYIVFAGAAS